MKIIEIIMWSLKLPGTALGVVN